jgi:hypothetical protein
MFSGNIFWRFFRFFSDFWELKKAQNQFMNGELSLAVEERDGKAQEAFAALNKLLYLEELLNVQKRFGFICIKIPLKSPQKAKKKIFSATIAFFARKISD